MSRFFSVNGVFRHTLHISDADETTDKQYEITFPAIARYFHTNFASGVKNMQLVMNKGTTDRPLPGDCHFIENTQASLVYWFETGSHVSHCPSFDIGRELQSLTSLACSSSLPAPSGLSSMRSRRSSSSSSLLPARKNTSHGNRSLTQPSPPTTG